MVKPKLYKTDIVRQIQGISLLMDIPLLAVCVGWEAAAVMHGVKESCTDIHVDVPNSATMNKFHTVFPIAPLSESNIFGDRYLCGADLEFKLTGWTNDDTVVLDGIRVMNLENLKSNYEYFHEHDDCGDIRRIEIKKIIDAIQGKIQDEKRQLDIGDIDGFVDAMSHMATTLLGTALPLIMYNNSQPNCPTSMKFWDAHDREWHAVLANRNQLIFRRTVNKHRGDYVTGGDMTHYLDPLVEKYTKYDYDFAVSLR